jgi:hypothetical protein
MIMYYFILYIVFRRIQVDASYSRPRKQSFSETVKLFRRKEPEQYECANSTRVEIIQMHTMLLLRHGGTPIKSTKYRP